ncbi:MAG: Stp1/IreP family PP2C-type Ser/Thr phosphatase [Betaproteobacteria bacterium]|nr:Stp1/IreP family PP2C-type Ser/Thr phosphatase [Betaproteobacteria bacterium]MCL2886301.1 Stp1/IreP family PP2C-type Ser/Thr phosphatase [Betaproteobacteria bacterium]
MKLSDMLEMAASTDPGLLRSYNEDAVFADAALGVAILADGMGGSNAGEVASGLACALLSSGFARFVPTCNENTDGDGDPAFVYERLIDEVEAANRAIFHVAQGDPEYLGMGTTLVLVWFYDNRVAVAHVGDSRCYRLRDNHFERLTRDHSVLQEKIDRGMIRPEDARFSRQQNLVTRALGVYPNVNVEVHLHEARPGDLLLLCSDGLSDMVTDEDIALNLQKMGGNLEQAVDNLVRLANDNGGRDNISVILARVRGDYALPRG